MGLFQDMRYFFLPQKRKTSPFRDSELRVHVADKPKTGNAKSRAKIYAPPERLELSTSRFTSQVTVERASQLRHGGFKAQLALWLLTFDDQAYDN